MFNQNAYALGDNRLRIRELYDYGRMRAAIVGDENVFDYSIGNPSIPAPRELDETILRVMGELSSVEIHSYTPAPGALELRKAIAEDLNRRYAGDIGPEDLFIGSGAAPELAAVFRALTVPGSQILAIAPYFPEYGPYVQEAGSEFLVVPADVPAFQIDLAALEALLTEHTQAIIVNSPNNPSGTVYTAQTLKALADLLKRKSAQYGHPIYIVSDEPYRELVYDGVEVPFLPAIYPNTIICYSYSKSLSLPGERIGYIYVPKQAQDSRALYAAIAGAYRALGHVCAPSLMQKVVARCAHLRPDLEAYDRNRRTLYEGLKAMGYQIPHPDGAFYLFIQAPGGDSEAFSRRAMELDLLLVPGEDFGCPGYLRVCYCVSHDRIVRSLPLFQKLIEA